VKRFVISLPALQRLISLEGDKVAASRHFRRFKAFDVYGRLKPDLRFGDGIVGGLGDGCSLLAGAAWVL
jgi:hypothetical protein